MRKYFRFVDTKLPGLPKNIDKKLNGYFKYLALSLGKTAEADIEQYGVDTYGSFTLRFIRHELLRHLFSPGNHKKWYTTHY